MSAIDTRTIPPGDVALDVRYEVKIPFPVEKTHEVIAWIHLHPEQWRIAFPPRQVNNIYFDTFSKANLDANLSGISDRQKLRIRWYGEDISCAKNAQLEVKYKQGSIGRKRIDIIPGLLDLTQYTWYEIMASLKNRLPVASILMQSYPVPVIINSYFRTYYTSPDEVLRLTVDTNLSAYDQQGSLKPNIRFRALPQPYTIVELKTHPDNAERLSNALSHSSSRVSRFSKYVHAIMASP